MTNCFHCNTHIQEEKPVRSSTCGKCSSDLYCCKNCKFYDTTSYNECREPQAERVVDKEKRNFCDYFSLGTPATKSQGSKKDDPKKALDDLFK